MRSGPERQASELSARLGAHHEAVVALREQTLAIETALRESAELASSSAEAQTQLERRTEELRQLTARLVEQSAQEQAESLQAEEAAARHTLAEEQRTAALRTIETEGSALAMSAENAEAAYLQAVQQAQELGATVRAAQARLTGIRRAQQETTQQLEHAREELSAARARRTSIEEILRERCIHSGCRAETPSALAAQTGRATTHLPPRVAFEPWACSLTTPKCRNNTKAPSNNFCAKNSNISWSSRSIRPEMAWAFSAMKWAAARRSSLIRARNLKSIPVAANAFAPLPEGVIARLDRLVDFRDPLGPAAKHFLTRLQSAYLVESAVAAERFAHEDPQGYFLTSDGTCYHGRMVSGGRKSDAGPLALKR